MELGLSKVSFSAALTLVGMGCGYVRLACVDVGTVELSGSPGAHCGLNWYFLYHE